MALTFVLRSILLWSSWHPRGICDLVIRSLLFISLKMPISCSIAAHYRSQVVLLSVTTDQYITHVADELVTVEHILRGADLRSQRLTMLLAEYTRDDDVDPLRLSRKISVT